jgi:hypothetical protein
MLFCVFLAGKLRGVDCGLFLLLSPICWISLGCKLQSSIRNNFVVYIESLTLGSSEMLLLWPWLLQFTRDLYPFGFQLLISRHIDVSGDKIIKIHCFLTNATANCSHMYMSLLLENINTNSNINTC